MLIRVGLVVSVVIASACSGDGDYTGGADSGSVKDAQASDANTSADATPDAAPDGGALFSSTLTSSCATLEGRAIVSISDFADDISISFTEAVDPFGYLGGVKFGFPIGFSGSIPNPEIWDGESPREIFAVTSADFKTFGNHCWFDVTPPVGTATLDAYDPDTGAMRATFSNFPVRSCVDTTVCTLDGTIETTGPGVFE